MKRRYDCSLRFSLMFDNTACCQVDLCCNLHAEYGGSRADISRRWY